MKRFNKLTLLVVLIIIIVAIVTIIFLLIINKNQKLSEKENIDINFPLENVEEGESTNVVSYNIPETINKSSNLTFTIDPLNNGINTNVKFNLLVNSYLSNQFSYTLDKSLANINSENFTIKIFSSHGTNGGFYKGVNIEEIITNYDLGGNIYRVISEIENFQPEFINNNYSTHFFYSPDFQSKEACSVIEKNVDGCGSQDFSIGDDNFKSSIGIYCSVNNTDNAKKCDEFVRNLKIVPKKISDQ